MPARRGLLELALGYVAGAIIHFATLNAGVIAVVKPLTLDNDTMSYLPAAAASPAILAARLLARRRLRRPEGSALLLRYFGYLALTLQLAAEACAEVNRATHGRRARP